MNDTALVPRTVAPRPLALGAVAIGCAALTLRPLLARIDAPQTAALLALFGALFIVALSWPLPRPVPVCGRAMAVAFTAAGVGAFALGRLVGGAHAAGPFTVRFVVLNSVAAVAEEAFFRRLVFGALEPAGVAVAVVGSALLFAVVHVTVYGLWVLPIDVAAGLVLSWQRWATGSWGASAVTHVVANVLAVV